MNALMVVLAVLGRTLAPVWRAVEKWVPFITAWKLGRTERTAQELEADLGQVRDYVGRKRKAADLKHTAQVAGTKSPEFRSRVRRWQRRQRK